MSLASHRNSQYLRPVLLQELACLHRRSSLTSIIGDQCIDRCHVQVHIITAACENMIDGRGMRPGDILQAANGKTVEVPAPSPLYFFPGFLYLWSRSYPNRLQM